MRRLLEPVRDAVAALRAALATDGLRRIELAWALGIAADTALLVVLLVEVFRREGPVGTGLLGAVRMAPAVVSGMLSSAALARFPGHRILLAIGIARAAAAGLSALVIAGGGPTWPLFLLAAIVATAGAPVRPTQSTLLPGLARSPTELIAANTASTTGEGLGAFVGPLVAGILVGTGLAAIAAGLTAAVFLATAVVVAGIRFEQAADAWGGVAHGGGLRLADGIRALGRRPVPRWSMVGVYGQVLTRGLLTTLSVAAAIELLAMGERGVGLLAAAMGLGGLLGAVFALVLVRADRLVRSMCASLAWWGAPIAIIGLVPIRPVAIAAMVVVGLANATYDVAVFTIFQRGSSNDERGPVFSVFEGVAGLGNVSGSLLGPVLLAAFGVRGALAAAGAILPILAVVISGRTGRDERVAAVDEATLQLLRAVPIFSALPLTTAERLAVGLVPATWPAGSVLMRQGDPGDRFVVIAAGEVDVEVDGRSVHRLGRGAGIGDLALLRRSARTATVTALTEVRGLTVDGPTFLAAVSGPAAAAVTERIAAGYVLRPAAEA